MERLQFRVPDFGGLREKWQREREQKEIGLTDKQISHLRAVENCESLNNEIGDMLFGNCDICKNKGLIYYLDDSDNVAAKDCTCMRMRKSRQALEYSGLKRLIKEKTFDAFTAKDGWQKSVKKLSQEYTEHSTDEWFFIAGQSGSGKTHLCTAISARLLERGQGVLYISYIKDFPEIKQLTLDTDRYNDILNGWLKTEVLYIDDLFKLYDGKSNADTRLALRIIDYRINNSLKTIISTEMTLNEIIGIDEATGGRIKRACGKYLIEISKDRNKNYRLKG